MSGPPAAGTGNVAEFGRFLEIQNLGLNLSFAIAFLLGAAHGVPSARVIVLVVVAFVAARNAGHSFNRWADRRFDALNPRTRNRALVTGRYSPTFALLVTAASAALLFVAAYLLNLLALVLAPVALAILFGYSFTKRFTAATTGFLGLVEAITPAGAYVAVTATLPWTVLPAIGGILLWGTAFETIHSVGDIDADRAAGLHSIPAALGRDRSIRLVPALHAGALALLAAYVAVSGLGLASFVALGLMALIVGVIDLRLYRQPEDTLFPFRAHFVLGLIFLFGVAVSVFIF
ncbi:MAG TPA: UbiA family prenyltransferase [Thermoplasmata archaeon]|nr:UbiA family prenyltransferase [Thermoplasmata archaeon]